MNRSRWRCGTCDGTNIEVEVMYSPNDEVVTEDFSNTDCDCHCNDCGTSGHTLIDSEEE